jgi:hypothetical protein
MKTSHFLLIAIVILLFIYFFLPDTVYYEGMDNSTNCSDISADNGGDCILSDNYKNQPAPCNLGEIYKKCTECHDSSNCSGYGFAPYASGGGFKCISGWPTDCKTVYPGDAGEASGFSCPKGYEFNINARPKKHGPKDYACIKSGTS